MNSFYLSILIGSIFLTLYQKKETSNNQFDMMRSPVITMILMVVGTVVFSIFLRKLIQFGFQEKFILYDQISIIVLAILSLAALIKIHVNLLKKRKSSSND